jgi:CheY-like chemotaxis protein
VDDEPAVRTVGRRLLQRLGYEVLVAADGPEALDLYREHSNRIAVVILDLTMPRWSGEETLCELRQVNPQVRVMLSSGYTQGEIDKRLRGQEVAGFIQKPYTLEELEEHLRTALAP